MGEVFVGVKNPVIQDQLDSGNGDSRHYDRFCERAAEVLPDGRTGGCSGLKGFPVRSLKALWRWHGAGGPAVMMPYAIVLHPVFPG